MSDQLNRVIFDLIQFKRASIQATEKFTGLGHNADLCPRFQERVETVFFAFDKYQRITYDIQGPRDKGADIIVKQRVEDELHFICFQIKSDNDLKSPDYLKILKAQWFDADRAYSKIDDYYIVLCCNIFDKDSKELLPLSKVAKDKIRNVAAEFATTENVHVIEPQFALSFLNLSTIQIDAVIKSKFGSEDVVFREALDVVVDLTPTENAILFYLTWLKIYQGHNTATQHDLLNSNFITSVYERVPDYNRDWFFMDEDEEDEYYDEELPGGRGIYIRLLEDLDHLDDNYISSDGAETYSLDLKSTQPIALLMMDANIRYRYEGDELFAYMMNLFSPMKGYEQDEGI